MFKTFGHHRVSVLDGGLKKWIAEHRPVDSNPVQITPTEFKATYNEKNVIDYDSLYLNITDFAFSKKFTVLDARSAGRFSGTVPEPREGLSSGHGTTQLT